MNARQPPTPAHDFSVTLEPVGAVAELAGRWRDLEARAEASFFLTWDWIGCWLAQAQPAPLLLLSARQGDTIVALALLAPARLRRHGIVRPQALMLHQTGDPARDGLFIEYNGILVDRAVAAGATQACIAFLIRHGPRWDELHCAGVTAAFEEYARHSGLAIRYEARDRSWRVDLDAVRRSGRPYLETVSANTRYQVRRAMRLYAARGAVRAEAAGSVDEAMAFFTELAALNRATWRSRSLEGSFAHPFAERFHRALVTQCVPRGTVEIVRIAASDFVIGYVYNFIHRGHVYNYQTGLAYEADPRLKPGLVSHTLAIERHLGAGAHVYDFMAGDQRYKSNLGTPGPEIIALALQRATPMLVAERALRALKSAVTRARP